MSESHEGTEGMFLNIVLGDPRVEGYVHKSIAVGDESDISDAIHNLQQRDDTELLRLETALMSVEERWQEEVSGKDECGGGFGE